MNRTEQPTPRRLREARRKGEVAVSRDLTGAAALLGGLVALAAAGPGTSALLSAHLRLALTEALGAGAAPEAALRRALALFAGTTVAPCAAAALCAAAVGALQTRGLLAFAALRPDLARLDPLQGLRRLASAERLVATALGVAKAALSLGVAGALLVSEAPLLARSPRLAATSLLPLLAGLGLRLALGLGAVVAALGVADLALAAFRLRRRLMMTHEEVKRERKDDEGDPRHKAERQRLHRALASAAPVRRATCVVVNPAHVAVALRHERESEAAPVVLAKGVGADAARIRAQARRAGVPFVRDVALARALFRLAEVGEEIPEELYEAAAAVLVHVHGMATATP